MQQDRKINLGFPLFLLQIAAEEARRIKIAEQQALLEGRLWEYVELLNESNIINLDDAKKVGA